MEPMSAYGISGYPNARDINLRAAEDWVARRLALLLTGLARLIIHFAVVAQSRHGRVRIVAQGCRGAAPPDH